MSLTINHNLMAYNTARNLNSHYASLSTSVRRLSSGLRVNSSADDAAGLAIRELMRADIASLNQGVRNVNDAVSMIQTADGTLQVIDEKLIRMKELAEQAATGTYNSDQRLMINSEFQAMKAEIDRIAKATDFNGVKLLCNDPANKLLLQKTLPDPSIVQGEYLVGWTNVSSIDSEILNPSVVTHDADLLFYKGCNISNCVGNTEPLNWYFMYGGGTIGGDDALRAYGPFDIKYDHASGQWISLDSNISVSTYNGTNGSRGAFTGLWIEFNKDGHNTRIWMNPQYTSNTRNDVDLTSDCTLTLNIAKHVPDPVDPSTFFDVYEIIDMSGNYNNISCTYDGSDIVNRKGVITIDLDGDGNDDIRQEYNVSGQQLAGGSEIFRSKMSLRLNSEDYYTTKIHFGTGNDSAEDYYYIDTKDCTANGLGIDGTSIETQDKAQRALEEINNAVIKKDTARAYFGAIQNRLENTASNLQIQAENLQAAESRISDVDVSTEMTEYARSQILTQAAVAMLAQANSLPNMALQLITNQ